METLWLHSALARLDYGGSVVIRFRTGRPCIPTWTTVYSEADAV